MNSRSLSVINWRRKTKQKLIFYNKIRIDKLLYDFHHRNPLTKSFGIGSHKTTVSWERLKIEVDKCDLLCKNCHAELHDEEYKSGLYIQHPVGDRKCPVCNEMFKYNLQNDKKFCSSLCAAFSRRKVERPSREELAKDIGNISWRAMGEKYKVSDNAVKKWAKKYNLI